MVTKLIITPEFPNGKSITLTSEEEAAKNEKGRIWEEGKFDREMVELRHVRNGSLSESDWVVTRAKEMNTPIPDDWKTYRQQLRDLPSGLTTFEEVQAILSNFTEFPAKPQGDN